MRKANRFHRSTTLPSFATMVLFAIALTSGCQLTDSSWKSFSWTKPEEPKLPQIVMPIWSDTVLHQPGKPGVRGFGGRVYFYEREGGDPIKVDGSLSVYVFDGDDKRISNTKPLRKFVIKPEQLDSHHSTSELGHSYSIWVPWEKVGGPSRALSLITRFDGRNGGTAISDPANKLLPGVAEEPEDETTTQPKDAAGVGLPGVQQVGFVDKVTPSSKGGSDQLNSYSLPLPPSFQRRLKSLPQSGTPISEYGTSNVVVETPVFPNATTPSSPLTSVQSSPSQSSLPQSGATQSGTTQSGTTQSATVIQDVPTPSAGSSPQRFPARREPKFQPGVSPIRTQPHRAGWPSALERTLR